MVEKREQGAIKVILIGLENGGTCIIDLDVGCDFLIGVLRGTVCSGDLRSNNEKLELRLVIMVKLGH